MTNRFLAVLVLFFALASSAPAQEDYCTKLKNKGQTAYNQGNYERAKEYFTAALTVCDDKTGIADWIGKCDAGIQTASQTIDIPMVYVAGGTFTMGCTAEQGDDCYDNEKPAHQVTLSSYYIGKYEVTQAQWKAVMGSNPSNFKGDNLPVEEVSWDDVQEFIRKLNAQTGKSYRLPTEAEWEFAARGGNSSRGYKYSGSNTAGSVAWNIDNRGEKTHPVGTKQANELGIYDMSGNVWEWCSDWYGSYSSGSQTNPKGANSDSDRVHRGGCRGNSAWCVRVSRRGSSNPDDRGNYLGFRLALSSN